MLQLKAGIAKTEITNREERIQDPLYAKVLILADGEKSIAWISLDCICLGGGIGGFSDGVFSRIKEAAKASGVDFVLCGTTHTHTPCGMMTVGETELVTRIKATVAEAAANMRPVTVGYGEGHENSFCINRTLRLKDGTDCTIRQAHPFPWDGDFAEIPYYDDTVRVLKIDDLDGTPFCVLFSYGCHPLLGYANNYITANFPGIAEQLIHRETGAMSMFFQSCGGDVTETDYKNYDRPKNCEAAGTALGLEVLRVLKHIQTGTLPLYAAEEPVQLPLRQDFAEERSALLDQREQILNALAGCPLNFEAFLPLYMKYLVSPEYPLGHAYEYRKEEQDGKSQLRDQDVINRRNIAGYLANMRAMEAICKINACLETLAWHEQHNASYGTDTVPAEILGVRIGEAILVTAPVEPLSQIANRVRKLSSLPQTSVIGYANGYYHYGAPPEAYHNGGYETVECMLAPEWEAIYEETVQRLLNRLTDMDRSGVQRM